MKSLHLKQRLPELHAIGSVTNIGATIVQGDPQASVAAIFGAATDNVSSGFFAVTRGTFTMVYPFTEHATVQEGVIKLTDEKTGESAEYFAGDSWFVEKGTTVRWEVISERFVKHYLAIVQG